MSDNGCDCCCSSETKIERELKNKWARVQAITWKVPGNGKSSIRHVAVNLNINRIKTSDHGLCFPIAELKFDMPAEVTMGDFAVYLYDLLFEKVAQYAFETEGGQIHPKMSEIPQCVHTTSPKDTLMSDVLSKGIDSPLITLSYSNVPGESIPLMQL